MPTYARTDRFLRDWNRLSIEDRTAEDRTAFREAVRNFVEDLATRQFRGGLRVKGVEGTDSIFEMTWRMQNGRATFQYGPEIHPGEPHVIWRRVGGHDIFNKP